MGGINNDGKPRFFQKWSMQSKGAKIILPNKITEGNKFHTETALRLNESCEYFIKKKEITLQV